MKSSNFSPRIYVECTGAGGWVDLVPDVEDLWDAVPDVLSSAPALHRESWMCSDHEGLGHFFPGLYPDIPDLAALVRLAASQMGNPSLSWMRLRAGWDAIMADAVSAYVVNLYHGSNIAAEYDDIEECFGEAYCGSVWSDWAHFAEDSMADSGLLDDVPSPFDRYIDWESLGRDMHLGGDYWSAPVTGSNYMHVFRTI